MAETTSLIIRHYREGKKKCLTIWISKLESYTRTLSFSPNEDLREKTGRRDIHISGDVSRRFIPWSGYHKQKYRWHFPRSTRWISIAIRRRRRVRVWTIERAPVSWSQRPWQKHATSRLCEYRETMHAEFHVGFTRKWKIESLIKFRAINFNFLLNIRISQWINKYRLILELWIFAEKWNLREEYTYEMESKEFG